MANNPELSNAARSAAANAVVDLLDAGAGAGLLRIYDGTQPAGPDTAVSTQVLLAELTFSDPAFGAASNGVATASAITADAAANATGTASWFRAVDSNGTAVFDGSVGTASADLVLNSTAIQSGAEVSISSLTYTQPAG
jgi:hypothetical protein